MMTLLLLTTAALAGDNSSLIDALPATGPAALTAAWAFLDEEACVVEARLSNSGSEPLEIDWMRSVMSSPGQAVEQLVPGTSSSVSVQTAIPPTVIPGGAFADVQVFRRGALPADEHSDRPGCFTSSHNAVTVMLSANGEWWTQEMPAIGRQVAAVQDEAWARTARMRRAAEDLRAAECEQRAEREDRYGRGWLTLAGVAAVGGGALLTGGGIYELAEIGHPLRQENGYPVLGLGTLAIGAAIGSGIIGWKQHHDARQIEEDCSER